MNNANATIASAIKKRLLHYCNKIILVKSSFFSSNFI